MNFILFGPPGVGKSTLIAYLKTLGERAIDLEDMYPNALRFQIPNVTEGVWLGAADLDPRRTYRNAVKILLYAPESVYRMRRMFRDSQVPGKSAQGEHFMEDWVKMTNWDLVFDTSPYRLRSRLDIVTVAKALLKEVEARGWK